MKTHTPHPLRADTLRAAGSPGRLRAASGRVYTRPPVLLTNASWYGTLAAARDLGARGVPVILGYDQRTAPSRWSRHVASAVRCPSGADTDRFLAWLHDFGRRSPGCVLYPTSDDVAFLIATHRESLAPYFWLPSTPLSALVDVLDKSRLWLAAHRAGLDAPATWSPSDEAALVRILDEVPMPVLVKPRAQILSPASVKGIRVHRREDLLAAWREVRAASAVDERALAVAPDLNNPIVQALHDVSERIYTVDGFAAADGEIVGALACYKTLQLPRRSGPGLCFEAADLDAGVLAGLERLCRETGFTGVFDVEFVVDGDRKLLIDFNPRFYNHMAFEIDRGLPLPWLAYLATLGETAAMRRVAAELRPQPAATSGIYVHDLPMRVLLGAQRCSGGMDRREAREWRAWMARHRGRRTDPARAHGDLRPALLDVAHQLRHPRALFRKAGL